jgi:hypothetical protein
MEVAIAAVGVVLAVWELVSRDARLSRVLDELVC